MTVEKKKKKKCRKFLSRNNINLCVSIISAQQEHYYAKAYVAVVLTVAAQASYARARVYAFV